MEHAAVACWKHCDLKDAEKQREDGVAEGAQAPTERKGWGAQVGGGRPKEEVSTEMAYLYNPGKDVAAIMKDPAMCNGTGAIDIT